jgi:hypothetical protein
MSIAAQPETPSKETGWETEIVQFLAHLSNVQAKTLDVLTRKRQMIMASDAEGLAAVDQEETTLMSSLQECLDQREGLLCRARQEGYPANNIRTLAKAMPSSKKRPLLDQVNQASLRSRLLQHESLTNWVLIQKTLIHLSQLIEIIATGGRLQPTYGKGGQIGRSGSLVNREV